MCLTVLQESVNTLRYAQRARFIQNNAVVNLDPHAAQVTALKAQIRELQVSLMQARGLAGAGGASGNGASVGKHTSRSVASRPQRLVCVATLLG